MMATIAFVTIISAILVFFIDEFLAYGKKLRARPYVFLTFSILLASALIEMYASHLLWLLIFFWIALLKCVAYLAQHLPVPGANQLAQIVVALVMAACPILIGWALEQREKKRFLVVSSKVKKRGYVSGLMIWVLVLLLFVLGVPGSNFSG
ncbi:MAG: hypothetical protein NXI01_09075 [Gammaproteobacteria bacterium]|nr:hypothetical protein [Gammaproteobacteria bacterium]